MDLMELEWILNRGGFSKGFDGVGEDFELGRIF